MSTERNFWTFAFEHPFLTFFAFDILVCGVVSLVRGRKDHSLKRTTKKAEKIIKEKFERGDFEGKQ
jgi:uncharacterized membrane protein